ncbi:Panacea domain-containing protein [Methylocella tundrae]|uniref:Antitoxin SocA-like Panacea domain-containing protein n=1 Tax=Methylocella tundrae TaxID=227605 RepID=A0A4U8Z4I9_METTU|nr:type II toxin-antitoxin system antitoxin SocA domain-containing protein [Methylocella tundrae]WPP03988.1 DUF4065 domain-containing protein [Methylocella tundrae]VFU10211.1 conserved protein of unknown function [Methylocella tundrae]
MTARIDSVCRLICELGSWKVTNLQLQKILYMSQMYYMGKSGGTPLVDARFEAWDYGPVEPSVYRKVNMFGANPIRDVFIDSRPFKDDDPRRFAIGEVCSALLPLRPGALVDITHDSKGAWAKHYVPGVRGIPIPDADILAEYYSRDAR